MQVASVGQQVLQRMPEAKEALGPDRDGDKDDAVSVKPSLPKGVGTLVDTKA